jgi:NAD-dependent deacetylase
MEAQHMGRLVIFTGAGLSADSGISTFRDANGLWENHDIEQVATYHTWEANRDIVHRFYNARRMQLAGVEPNAAHHMIARLQERFPDTVVITQNIDNLMERAGVRDVMHVHGNLTEMKCKACGHVWDIGYTEWDPDHDRCPNVRGGHPCNSRRGVKPNVIFFGEIAPLYPKMWRTFDDLTEQDVLMVIGTSGQVIDIGQIAGYSVATTILSNLETAKTLSMPGMPVIEDRHFDIVMHGRAAEMAGTLEQAVMEKMLASVD